MRSAVLLGVAWGLFISVACSPEDTRNATMNASGGFSTTSTGTPSVITSAVNASAEPGPPSQTTTPSPSSPVAPPTVAEASSALTSGIPSEAASRADSSTEAFVPSDDGVASSEQPASSSAPSSWPAPSEGSSPMPNPLTPIKVFIAGDSTVASYKDTASSTDQAGWGQMLVQYLSELAVVDNRAVGGTTSRSYIDFGHLDEIGTEIQAGDGLLVQFGTNDGNKTATYDLNGQEVPYYLDPATDFKSYLGQYVEFAMSKDVHLVFVTPPPRNSAYCTGGNGTGAHAQAMRELGADLGVPVVDLNTRSVDYLKAICPAPTPEDFYLLRADGTVDGTHFQENGARSLAGFVAEELATAASPLAGYVTPRP